MVIIHLAYAGSSVLIKVSLERGLNQLVFVVYRHVIAMLLLCPFAFVLERKNRPALSLWLIAKIFLLASFGTTIHLNLYYAGIKYTSPTVAGALSNVIPGLTIAVAILLGMENVKDGGARGTAKGIILSALVYCLQTWCISKKGPVFAAMFSPLQLVIVGLFSAVVFGERLHLGSLIGALVIIVGLYCVLWGKQTDISDKVGETCSKAAREHEDEIIDISVDNHAVQSRVEERDIG